MSESQAVQQNNTTDFIKTQLEKPMEDSKKWMAFSVGLKGIAGMMLVGFLLFIFKPDLASQISTLVQFGVTAWAGIVGVYLGAQGTVEYKATAALQQTLGEQK